MSCISFAGYTYVDGIIQTEKKFECNSEETTSYISIAMHNATLVSVKAFTNYTGYSVHEIKHNSCFMCLFKCKALVKVFVHGTPT